jgi:hypothetical protein
MNGEVGAAHQKIGWGAVTGTGRKNVIWQSDRSRKDT